METILSTLATANGRYPVSLDERAAHVLKVSIEDKYQSGNGILNENGRAFYVVDGQFAADQTEPLTTPASSN